MFNIQRCDINLLILFVIFLSYAVCHSRVMRDETCWWRK